MRSLLFVAAFAAAAVPALPVMAQHHDDRRDWHSYHGYDYNHPEPGQRAYYADRYYRDGRYYQPRRLTRADRGPGNGRIGAREDARLRAHRWIRVQRVSVR